MAIKGLIFDMDGTLTESQKQDILNRAHSVRSEEEMYALVASLANGTM